MNSTGIILNNIIKMQKFRALYIIHIGKDLVVFEYYCEADHWLEVEEGVTFHFEERLEPTKEFALFYKENYFKEESEDTWDVIELVEVKAP